MAAVTEQTALRKRQQIAGANRMMFMWVAGASVILGVALVLSIFLVQKLLFNERILGNKQHTAGVLSDNLKAIDQLKGAERVLNTDPNLRSVMTPEEQEPIQVVLDALPSAANSTAVGASLQQKFLNDPALQVQNLTVDSTDNGGSGGSSSGVTASTAGQYPITFHFVVNASDATPLQTLLQKLESSIRTFDLTNVKLDVQSGSAKGYTLTVDGTAFYQPGVSAKLKDKTLSPKGNN